MQHLAVLLLALCSIETSANHVVWSQGNAVWLDGFQVSEDVGGPQLEPIVEEQAYGTLVAWSSFGGGPASYMDIGARILLPDGTWTPQWWLSVDPNTNWMPRATAIDGGWAVVFTASNGERAAEREVFPTGPGTWRWMAPTTKTSYPDASPNQRTWQYRNTRVDSERVPGIGMGRWATVAEYQLKTYVAWRDGTAITLRRFDRQMQPTSGELVLGYGDQPDVAGDELGPVVAWNRGDGSVAVALVDRFMVHYQTVVLPSDGTWWPHVRLQGRVAIVAHGASTVSLVPR